MTDLRPPEEPARSFVSRWLSRADGYASRPLTAVLVIGAVVVWVIISVALGFPQQWEVVFQSLVAAVTLAMVFVIQHTQARHQRATQRKLDEIILALPDADKSLVTLEHASDEELHVTGHHHRKVRQAAIDDDAGSGPARRGSAGTTRQEAKHGPVTAETRRNRPARG